MYKLFKKIFRKQLEKDFLEVYEIGRASMENDLKDNRGYYLTIDGYQKLDVLGQAEKILRKWQ